MYGRNGFHSTRPIVTVFAFVDDGCYAADVTWCQPMLPRVISPHIHSYPQVLVHNALCETSSPESFAHRTARTGQVEVAAAAVMPSYSSIIRRAVASQEKRWENATAPSDSRLAKP